MDRDELEEDLGARFRASRELPEELDRQLARSFLQRLPAPQPLRPQASAGMIALTGCALGVTGALVLALLVGLAKILGLY